MSAPDEESSTRLTAGGPPSDVRGGRPERGPEPAPPVNLVVIGDVMADIYVTGSVSRLCQEAPVPVLDASESSVTAGGAGNAATNAASLGARVELVSLCGRDAAWERVRVQLEGLGIGVSGVVPEASRETLVKRRYLSDGQILLRVDGGTTEPPDPRVAGELAHRASDAIEGADAVLVSDYGYGSVCDTLVERLAELRAEHDFTLVVDSKDLGRFSALAPDAVKPNYRQAVSMLGLEAFSASDRVDQMWRSIGRLAAMCASGITVVSMDADGVLVRDGEGRVEHVPAVGRPGSHAVGAGDTFTAALAIALAQGRAPFSAARFAADAAARAVAGTGTTVVGEVAEATATAGKPLLARRELAGWASRQKALGRRVVLTNGCFDILHSGHVDLLARARERGDVLLVALNTDASVRRLKGRDRPVNAETDRAALLLALESVDAVTLFDEPTPDEVVRQVAPDVFVKGGDYSVADLPEAREVERLGGTVVILPYLEGHSTTGLIERCREMAT